MVLSNHLWGICGVDFIAAGNLHLDTSASLSRWTLNVTLDAAQDIALFFFLYFFFRITSLVLTFIDLRSLPPRAYQKVNWTAYIPHI